MIQIIFEVINVTDVVDQPLESTNLWFLREFVEKRKNITFFLIALLY